MADGHRMYILPDLPGTQVTRDAPLSASAIGPWCNVTRHPPPRRLLAPNPQGALNSAVMLPPPPSSCSRRLRPSASASPPEAFTVLERQPDGPRITPYLTYQTDMAWRQDDRAAPAFAGDPHGSATCCGCRRNCGRSCCGCSAACPSTRTPLNAQVTGRIQMTGFHIEKVVFESLPGIFVTALVYVPDGGRRDASGGAGAVRPLDQRQGALSGPLSAARRARLRRDQLGSGGPGRAQPVLGRALGNAAATT